MLRQIPECRIGIVEYDHTALQMPLDDPYHTGVNNPMTFL
jgi:hypothetical protein